VIKTLYVETSQTRLFVILFCASISAILLFFRWDLLFYDSIYYLRTVSDPKLYNFYWTPSDRWTHVNFLWLLVKAFGGASAITFEAIVWIYRAIMAAAVLIWLNVLKRFWPEPLKLWGLLFLMISPMVIYNLNQILPDNLAFLFSGIGIGLYLFALDRRLWILTPVAGIFFYLTFLTRSDWILMPAAFVLSCLLCGYTERKSQLAMIAGLMLTLVPLIVWHIETVKIGNLAPMAKAMWNYQNPKSWLGNLGFTLREYGRAMGVFFPLALLGIRKWEDRNFRILAVATLLIYSVFFAWVLTWHVGYGRQTMQGAILVSTLAVFGFSEFLSLQSADRNTTRFEYFFYAGWILYVAFIAYGNHRVRGNAVFLTCFFILLIFLKNGVFKTPLTKWPVIVFIVAALIPFVGILAAGRTLTFFKLMKSLSSSAIWGSFLFFVSMILTKRFKPAWSVLVLYLGVVTYQIAFANSALGGVNLTEAKAIFNQVSKNPKNLFLIADDPTFYFYRFYYSERSDRTLLCFVGPAPEQRNYFRTELKKQLGNHYAATLEEIKEKNPEEIFFLGTPSNSWLTSEPSIDLEPVKEFPAYKGDPIYKVSIHKETAS
jgi:hypothetical protein